MLLKLWGTRGSLPQSLSQPDYLRRIDQLIAIADAKGIRDIKEFRDALHQGKLVETPHFGGHTTCTEVKHGSTSVFVDSGTGITDAIDSAMQSGRKEFDILQTHMHWDHIIGLPFFVPIYIPGFTIRIHHVHANAPEFIRILFNGINFPVKWEDLGAKVEFVHLKLYEPTKFGDLTVSPFALDHPGGSFGYRFDAAGKSAAIGVDGEFKRMTPKELGKDLKYYQGLNVLLFDAQYELDELASRFDWGHSSPPIGVDLALREGIHKLILCHHDPRATPDRAQAMVDGARRHCKTQLPAYKDLWVRQGRPEGPEIVSAFDGMVLNLAED